jgi:hypothetical protein
MVYRKKVARENAPGMVRAREEKRQRYGNPYDSCHI